MIELEKAGYSFGTTEVFSDVSVRIPDGSFHFLTGASGAGKTTFLRLCYLDLMPTSGAMSILGKPAAEMDRDAIAGMRRRIGVVHQDCQFLDHLSVAANVALPLVVAGREPEAHRAELDDLLKWVGLWDRRHAKPTELSGGERQRAALARAVILSPEVIIADEPTGNVDWDMGQRVLTLLCELNRMGKTILIATHDMNLIRSVGSSVSARLLRLANRGLTAAGAAL